MSNSLWHHGAVSNHREPSPFRLSYRQFSDIAHVDAASEPVPTTSMECATVKKSSKKKFRKKVKSFFGKLFD